MLNGERKVAWFWLLHAILLTIFVASLVHARSSGRAREGLQQRDSVIISKAIEREFTSKTALKIGVCEWG